MRSQSHKHNSVHYFFTSANHKAISLRGIASVHEFANSASHKANSLTDMTVHEFVSSDNHEASDLICTAGCMYLPTSHSVHAISEMINTVLTENIRKKHYCICP